MQHPLLLGIAGHNYLVLRDDTGAIKAELHGLATDESTGNWKYVGSRDTDTLKVWEFDGPRRYEANKKSPGIITFQGSQSETALLWNKAQICKERINELHLRYPPFGVAMRGETENSNSVAYTLTKCMDLPTKGVGWFTPGNGRDLLDSR